MFPGAWKGLLPIFAKFKFFGHEGLTSGVTVLEDSYRLVRLVENENLVPFIQKAKKPYNCKH